MTRWSQATAMGGQTPGQGASNPADASAQQKGVIQNPITWLIGMAVLVALMIFLAHKTGKAEEFSNIRGSAYNIVEQTLVVIVGITILKVIFTKFNVPGLSPLIQAV
jgi:hypothetical protein